jgi:hypothetical protein
VRPTAANNPRNPSHAISEIHRPQFGPVRAEADGAGRVSAGVDS